jgi:hypothetical protein
MFSMRQSTVSGFAVCPRRTFHDITSRPDDVTVGYSGSTAALGRVFHAVSAAIFRTLWEQQETTIPTQEAVEIMLEVHAASDEVLTADDQESLRVLVLRLIERPWNMKHSLPYGTDLDPDPDARLRTRIMCQDGIERELTGRPDLIGLGGDNTLVIVDLKSGWAKGRTPRGHSDGEVIQGKEYLSDRGHAQGDAYGLLAMREYPQAERVIFREHNVRTGDVREAVLSREELEHVEREVGVQLQQLDRGLAEGEASQIWKPRPGKHCIRQCPVARSCPIPEEQRGPGAISEETAEAQAARYAQVEGLRSQLRDGLLAFHEETGRAIPVGNGMELRRATPEEHKSRQFGLWPVREEAGA